MEVPRDLTRAMLVFAGLLRDAGLPVTTSAVMDAVAALDVIDVADGAEVYLALRTVLMAHIEEQPGFDRCFESFWRSAGWLAPERAIATDLPDPAPAFGSAGLIRDTQRGAVDAGDANEDDLADNAALDWPSGSEQEELMRQDFSTFAANELEEVSRLTLQIAKRLAQRVNRRRRPARRRGTVDVRRSLRASVLKGEIVELRRLARRRRKLSLVLLCDVSGSMDVYSRFLLQFLYAIQNLFDRVETFTFATRVTCVTELLRGPSYAAVLRRLREVHDWSGGTRIGESLREFNMVWGGRLVDRRTVVIILSDGWDTGEPEVLAGEMLLIKRRAAQVIWLNPLLGNPLYEPLNRGMAAALPFIHYFAPAHNLASLHELAGRLVLR